MTRKGGPVLPTGLTRQYVEDALIRAAELGHELGPDLDKVKVTKTGTGISSTCSCGWQSSPKSKRIKAFAAAFIHIGEVLGDDIFTKHQAAGAGDPPAKPERPAPTYVGGGGEGEPS